MSRAALNAAALAERLNLSEWQVNRAHRDGLIPAKDRSVGWSADLADTLVRRYAGKRGDGLRRRIGRVPDMGTWHAASYWAAWCGMEDGPALRDAVRELAHLGVLTIRYWDREYPVFDGRTIEAVTDPEVVRSAAVTGRTLMADEAAANLRIRRSDFDHAVRAGLINSCRWTRTHYTSKAHDPGMSLYRAADVKALGASDVVDWDAVRATPKGHRSPLAKLPDAKDAR